MGKVDKQKFEKTLYKYRDADLGIKLLCEHLIKLTKPKELNDPFEAIPSLNFINSNLTNFKRIVMKMKNETAVFSLSTDPLDISMWAHYVDDFKGICIGFNKNLFSDEINLYEVKYNAKRPSINKIDFENPNSLLPFVIDLMNTKSIQWENEDEYRYLFDLSGEDINKDLILHNFDPESIREVIIGPRVCKNSLERLKKILCQDIYIHVKIFGLEYKDSTSYSLNKYEIHIDELIKHENRLSLNTL